MKSRLSHVDTTKVEGSGCGLFNAPLQKIMKAKEAPNSNDMCHSDVLLAFLHCTSFTVQDQSAQLSQYRGYVMGRKAEDWGSTVSEGVIFLFTQTDSGKYEFRPAVKKLYQLRPKVTASNVSVASRG
jgi:hypothetical protein